MQNWKKEIKNLDGWAFGDTPQMTDELARQTASGKNLANCYLFSDECQLPKVGDRSYVKNSQGDPVCVVVMQNMSYVCKLPSGMSYKMDASEEFQKCMNLNGNSSYGVHSDIVLPSMNSHH